MFAMFSIFTYWFWNKTLSVSSVIVVSDSVTSKCIKPVSYSSY